MSERMPTMTMALERNRHVVRLEFKCSDDYDAMWLYDRISGELHAGRLSLLLDGTRLRSEPAKD